MSTNYSRAYLRHLFKINDPLAYRLATIHNLRFYTNLAYVLSDNFDSRVRYEATDINLDNIELVNKILSLYDLQAKIYGSDILCDIPNGEWDVVFLFKIVPLLEQQKKDISVL